MRLLLSRYLPVLFLYIIGITNVSWTFQHPSIISSKGIIGIEKKNTFNIKDTVDIMYDSLKLDRLGLSEKAFDYAIEGYEKLKKDGQLRNSRVITIVDFDQPSYKKRMYVIDVKNYKVLFNTWSAHGKNSGQDVAQHFSNLPESNQSSLGFYVTNDTYYGSKGYSLKLTGLERNLNDKALERAIVLHGADYVSQEFINIQGYIGRSHGCPAVPQQLNKPIIEKIKNGSLLFIYNKSYKPSKRFQLA